MKWGVLRYHVATSHFEREQSGKKTSGNKFPKILVRRRKEHSVKSKASLHALFEISVSFLL